MPVKRKVSVDLEVQPQSPPPPTTPPLKDLSETEGENEIQPIMECNDGVIQCINSKGKRVYNNLTDS